MDKQDSQAGCLRSAKNMKKLISILLLIAFSVNILLAQTNKPGVKQVYSPKVEILESTDPADNFADKGLPEPSIIGSNPSPKLAAELAKEISKYDDNSLPLLMATLQKAGFHIINENQKELYRPIYGDGIGLAFYDFEVAGMLKGSKNGLVTNIAKIADVIDEEEGGKSSGEIANAILKDINDNLKSKNPERKFLASLIVELGKQSIKPVDLTTASPQTAVVNLIQASLIERIILGDIVKEFERLSGESAILQNYSNSSQTNFITASYQKPQLDVCEAITDTTSVIKVVRTATKVAETLSIFTNFTDFIKGKDLKNLQFFKDRAVGIKLLNLGLVYAKYAMAMSSVKGEIVVESPLPLKKLKTRQPGETRKLTGKFRIEFKNSKTLNCLGSALESFSGIKFSVPKDGPMVDKPVSWEIRVLDGDDPRMYKNQDYYDIAYLESIDGKGQTFQKTNSNGESSIKLVGKPQKRDASELIVPVPKRVKVMASVALEKMDFAKDAPKIGKSALSLVKLDPTDTVIALLEAVPEIASKGKNSNFSIIVPVQDWGPCSEDWAGFINVKRQYSKIIVVKSSRKSNGNSSGDGVRTITENDEAKITLNPRTPEEVLQKADRKKPIVSGKGKRSDIFRLNSEGNPCCGSTEGSWRTKIQEGKIYTYDSIIENPFRFLVRPTERDYTLSFENNSFSFPGHRREFKEVDSDCEIDRDESSDKTEDANINFSPSLDRGRYGERVVNSEGELLFGTKEVILGDGAKMIWNWALARCQK